MTSTTKNKRSGRGLSLFGMIFLLIGLGVIVAGPVQTLYEHFTSADWPQVPAELDTITLKTHSGSDSTTYSVEASYRYQFNGRSYVGTRVGYDIGSDNLDDYHRQVVARLKRARQNDQIRVWVNPDDPSESYLVRELRWRKMLFMGLFGVVFGSVGLFIQILARARTAKQNRQHGILYSAEKGAHWLLFFFAFLMIAMSLPAVLAIPEELAQGNWLILAVLLFPIVAAAISARAWKSRRNWRFYGPTPLTMDPFPGQVGGDIGGRIELPRHIGPEECAVTLKCFRVRISRGKNSSRHESLIWQEEQAPEIRSEGSGTVACFRFTPPDHLPATDSEGRQQIVWRLVFNGPSRPYPLERTYELPVEQGSQKSTVTLSQSHVQRSHQRASLRSSMAAAEQIDVQATGTGFLVRSPGGRNLVFKTMIFLFGLVFTGVGVGLFWHADAELTMYFMGAVFSLFGVPFTLGGLFMLGRSLEARISGTRVESTRFWCGISMRRRQGELMRADQLLLIPGGSMTQGNRTKEFFSLAFKDGDQQILLAEGIVGRPVAEALRDNLTRLLRLPEQ